MEDILDYDMIESGIDETLGHKFRWTIKGDSIVVHDEVTGKKDRISIEYAIRYFAKSKDRNTYLEFFTAVADCNSCRQVKRTIVSYTTLYRAKMKYGV